MILSVKFGWDLMETVEGVLFRKSWNQKFCKVQKWLQTKLKVSAIKSTLHMCTVVHWVPNVLSVSLYDQSFLRYSTFDSYVKISNCHKIFYFLAKSLYSPMTALLIIKFGPGRMKTVGGAFCNFQAHMVQPCQGFIKPRPQWPMLCMAGFLILHLSVCVSVCPLTKYLKKYWTDQLHFWWNPFFWHREETTRFWKNRPGVRVGIGGAKFGPNDKR